MKKLSAVLLAALMLIAFAGCGNDKTSENSTASAETDITKSETNSSKKFETLQDYFDDPVNTEGFEDIKNAMGNTVDAGVYVEGNTIVYDYRFLTDIDSSKLGSAKETLDTTLDAYESTYKNTVSEIQNTVDEDITLRVVYRNADKTVITERTYKP